jgi:hypothetical protein
MKKIISASFFAALTLTMLLPVTGRVNAASVNRSILRQGGSPIPSGGKGGGHFQGGSPIPSGGSGGGHFQGGSPIPSGGSGGGHFQGGSPIPSGGSGGGH